MKGKLIKIYGKRDPTLEARRMEIHTLKPPPDSFSYEAATLAWFERMERISKTEWYKALERGLEESK